MKKNPYVLTDGREVFAYKEMTHDEFLREEKKAFESTDGIIGWTRHGKTNRPIECFERLHDLISRGVVRSEGGYYIGTAADGVEVSIGCVGYEDQVEVYLMDYPTPAHW